MIRFYDNLESYTDKYIHLVGKQFKTRDELKSEIALMMAEIINRHKNKSDRYIFDMISSNISSRFTYMEKFPNEDKVKFEPIDIVDNFKSVVYNNIENTIIINDLLNKLSMIHPAYKDILVKYYLQNYTLNEIGEEYGLSSSRIGQLRDKAIRQIRLPGILKLIDDNVEGYCTRKCIENYIRSESVDKEKQTIDKVAKILIDSYLVSADKFHAREIIIHHMKDNFESRLRSKIKENIITIRELYSKTRLSKINFINMLDNSIPTFTFKSNLEVNMLFEELIYLLEERLNSDVELLIANKRIEL